jgi:Trk K+ transport system NAD-binding subunit
MIAGKRFVICGLSRLTTRVAKILAERGAEVVIVRGAEGEELVGRVESEARVLSMAGDREGALRAAGVSQAACLLALADDDMANLQTTVAAREIAPKVPVVLRAFDPLLADELEQGLNVRRAYSVSALSAPAFVAAALAEEAIETMRLGDAVVPICRLSVRPGSPIIGHTARELKRAFRCGVLARAGPDGIWRRAFEDEERFEAGEQVLIGGVLWDVLDLARRNSPMFADGTRHPPPRRLRRPSPAARRPRTGPAHVTLLPKMGAALGLLLLLAVLVFAQALHLPPVDAFYFVVTTATTTGYGDFSLRTAPAWLKLFGCAVMLSGGALLAIFFSHLAAVATAERLEEQMGRRAQRLSRHAVVAGLGNVGYRVTRLLSELGLPAAVLELAPDARFVEAVRQRAVVLSGDARLPENLERASIREAAIFLACTDDDLTNVLACLHARRLNPSIRTVARIFDDLLAERLTSAFQIDAAISSGKVTASAFVGAATDERALRPFCVGSQSYLAFRYDVSETVSLGQIEAWRAEGLRILAFRRASGDAQPPSDLAAPLEPGDEAIVAGPEATLRELMLPLSAADTRAG